MIGKNSLAVANAIKVIDELCISYPGQYSIKQIINAKGLVYREADLTGSIGNIIHNDSNGVVTVSSKLSLETQKIFTAAHELGHFENEKIRYKNCSLNDVFSFKNNTANESAANDFAAELLMHEPWFIEYTKNKKLNINLLSDCAKQFSVSLSAAAFRYAEIGSTPCAIIMSTEGVVKWSSINKSFPYQFLRNGARVDKWSYAYDLHKAMHGYKLNRSSYEQMIQKFAEVPKEEDVPAFAWFNEDFLLKGDKNKRIMEANFAMQNFNSVLTLLWEV